MQLEPFQSGAAGCNLKHNKWNQSAILTNFIEYLVKRVYVCNLGRDGNLKILVPIIQKRHPSDSACNIVDILFAKSFI